MCLVSDLTDSEFGVLRDYIYDTIGINLGNEKKSMVYSRLRTVLKDGNFENFNKYFDYLKNDRTGEAVTQFIDKITTNHTFFMRETDHFDYFKDTVLPYIEKEYGTAKDLRLWCAACSSGEEAYTLQIIITEYFAKDPSWNKEMLATDISTKVLDKAVAGVYSDESLRPLSDRWKKEYFRKTGNDQSAVADSIKRNVVFRRFNLMDDRFPFKKKFQVIFCRNVMIYFDSKTRDELVNKFYDNMEQGGYLFIGHSESLNQTKTAFKYAMPAVYRKV